MGITLQAGDVILDLLLNYYAYLAAHDRANAQQRVRRYQLAYEAEAVDRLEGKEYLCRGGVNAPSGMVGVDEFICRFENTQPSRPDPAFAECLKHLYDVRTVEVRLHLGRSVTNTDTKKQMHILLEQVAWAASDLYPSDIAITITLVVNEPCQADFAALLRWSDGEKASMTALVARGNDRVRVECWKALGRDENPCKFVGTIQGLELLPLHRRLQIRVQGYEGEVEDL